MNKLLCPIVAFAFAIGLAAAAAVQAQPWPTKPVTLLVPFPPGGSTDMIARTLGARMQDKLGQPVVVENKAGATGTIGAAQVKRAAPDGYTVLVSSLGPFVIAPHLIKNVPYDAGKDFGLISVLVQAPNVLVVPAASPFKSVADVIAALKNTPDKLSFASSGNGSSDHLTAELFWQQTGSTGVHVPYKGGGPAMSDLLGAQVAASFQNIGVKGVDVYSWQAAAAPKGLPAEVKAKLHATLVAALNDPAVKPKLLELGFEIVGGTPEHFAEFQARENARWKQLIEARKITAD